MYHVLGYDEDISNSYNLIQIRANFNFKKRTIASVELAAGRRHGRSEERR